MVNYGLGVHLCGKLRLESAFVWVNYDSGACLCDKLRFESVFMPWVATCECVCTVNYILEGMCPGNYQ